MARHRAQPGDASEQKCLILVCTSLQNRQYPKLNPAWDATELGCKCAWRASAFVQVFVRPHDVVW